MFQPRILTITLAALLLAACTRPADDAAQSAGKSGAGESAAAKSATVATVNGQKLNQELLDVFAQAVMGGAKEPPTDEQKSQMIDQLINMTLAAQAAEKEGLAKDPKVKARMELIQTQVLAEAASEKYLSSHPSSESELKAEYDAQVAAMPKEYKARHILVDTEEKAKEIIAKLEAGGDFAKLASTESKDSSNKNGGDLGWFSPQTMVKPFADAVQALQVGQYTKQPVQSEFGWHVILLEDVRSPEVPAFEQVKSQVEMFSQRKKLQAYIDELRKNAQVQK